MRGEVMCEACLTAAVEREITTEIAGRPFKVCERCAIRVENLALRPLEWYRLSVLHGPFTYLLHDDFYDEEGKADQNNIEVKQASLFPAPKLADVANGLDTLLDYSLTRWHLTDETISAFKQYQGSDVLAAISNLVENRPIPWVEARCYEIAATVLGRVAEQWVRGRWERGSRADLIHPFMAAVAACMPHEKAVPLAITAVESSSTSDISLPALSLAQFHSSKVISWIEQVAKSPVSDRWGVIAARSGLSWATATRWLNMGRPMSLVAVDAIGAIMRPERGGKRPTPSMRMDDAPADHLILERLREYAARDPVPRVTQMIERIIASSARG